MNKQKHTHKKKKKKKTLYSLKYIQILNKKKKQKFI